MALTKKYYTREELIKLLNQGSNGNISFFFDIYRVIEGWHEEEDVEDSCDFDFENQKVEIAYEQNFGDGNDWHVALFFPKENLNVFMSGWYSSQGDSELTRAFIGIEYEFKEMRFKAASKDELRDMNIEEIIK